MMGTILNCIGILAGAVFGRFRNDPPKRMTEAYMRIVLSAFIVFYGLRLTWISINGSLVSIGLQLLVTIASLSIGKVIGQFVGLQKLSNSLGQFARERLARPGADPKARFNEGFATCTALFCAAPLAIAGAITDGLSSYFYPLAAKGVIEAFAAFGFVRIFGWGVALAVIPVLAFQGTITLVARYFEPVLAAHNLVDPINAVAGLLIFSVALVMLEIKKLHLADYLPSLLVAPLLTRALAAL